MKRNYHFHDAVREENARAAKVTLDEFLATIEAMDKPKLVPYVKPDRQVEQTEEF